ncbi:metalloregulator ArsR/SmtB family transcription factor [Nocardia sp. NPDC046473]|uniref:ArsR/SmtB family transcription factor n=1 Tax=Nocardia sp. NPDC046473 TaxID=3155733 RepID=UPI00340CA4B4
MSKQDLPLIASTDCCNSTLAAPLGVEAAVELAAAFKALADPVRLRLLSLIASRPGEEVCVCELTPQFELSQPTISHHLKVLREAGLIDCERRGTWVYYWAIPAALHRLSDVLTTTDSGKVDATA